MSDGRQSASTEETTRVLAELSSGDEHAADRLLPLVYDELRRMAGACFRGRDKGSTLQPTALVHEVYLRLIRQSEASFRDRAHFMAVAARAMRQILIDRARRSRTQVHGGGRRRVPLTSHISDGGMSAAPDILVFNEVMVRLAEFDGRLAKVVEMRVFGGMSIEEVAEVLGVSRTTITKDWRMARSWIAKELAESDT